MVTFGAGFDVVQKALNRRIEARVIPVSEQLNTEALQILRLEAGDSQHSVVLIGSGSVTTLQGFSVGSVRMFLQSCGFFEGNLETKNRSRRLRRFEID